MLSGRAAVIIPALIFGMLGMEENEGPSDSEKNSIKPVQNGRIVSGNRGLKPKNKAPGVLLIGVGTILSSTVIAGFLLGYMMVSLIRILEVNLS